MSTFEALLSKQFPQSQIKPSGFWASGEQQHGAADWVSPLFQYDFLHVDGPDSSTFLQGQTSCDWRAITPAQSSRGAYCNIKGRVLSSFIGAQPSETLALLRMRADICENTRSLLKKYIVFSKAEIGDQPRARFAIGVAGPGARQRLRTLFGAAPSAALESLTVGTDTIIVQLDDDGLRYECWLTDTRAAEYWPALCDGVAVCDSADWERDNILQGIGEVHAATQDLFLPQQLNYQLVGAVNFKKGCYTGQEVVARIQYRGKLKRRLYAAKVDAFINESDATELFGDGDTQSIGKLVSLYNADDHSILLAVLAVDAVNSPIFTADGKHRVTLLPLPYELPDL